MNASLVANAVRSEQHYPLQWRHNWRDCVSNHQPRDCLLNCLFRLRSKKTSKLRVTGLWAGNSPGTGEFPAQMASNAENVSIWWRHHADSLHTTSSYAHSLMTIMVFSFNFHHKLIIEPDQNQSPTKPCSHFMEHTTEVWLGTVRQQTITRSNVDLDTWHHRMSPVATCTKMDLLESQHG